MKGHSGPRQRARLKDIASELGVTEAAVSKALRDAGDIGPELKKRVLECARKLNYQPNAAARSLVTRRTYTVGLVLPDLMTSFFAEIAMGAARRLQPHGYTLMLANSDESVEMERREVEQLLARRVDGLLVASASARDDLGLFERIRKSRTPLVLVDREFPGYEVDFAGADNVEVGRLATAYLAGLGCRSIAHLACERLRRRTSSVPWSVRGTRQAWRATMEKTRNLPYDSPSAPDRPASRLRSASRRTCRRKGASRRTSAENFHLTGRLRASRARIFPFRRWVPRRAPPSSSL